MIKLPLLSTSNNKHNFDSEKRIKTSFKSRPTSSINTRGSSGSDSPVKKCKQYKELIKLVN